MSRRARTSWSATSRPGWSSGWRSAAPSFTSRSCCCSTSPAPTSIPRRPPWSSRCSARRAGRTARDRHPRHRAALAEGDRVLALRARRRGSPITARPAGSRRATQERSTEARRERPDAGARERPRALTPSGRSSRRTCGSSCARSSRCRRWRCSRSPLHPVPLRARSNASTAAWPPASCWRRCCSPRSWRSTACSSPSVTRAASTRSGSRPSMESPWRRKGRGADRLPASSSRRSRCPSSRLFFLDSWTGLAPLAGVLLLADLGLAATGRRWFRRSPPTRGLATCSSRWCCCRCWSR